MDYDYRHTKIIFTIGPATESEAVLEQLLRHGADVCRLNMAHANHEWVREVCARVRRVSERVGREIALLMDVKGPEIRTGKVESPLTLEPDQLFDFYLDNGHSQRPDGVQGVTVNYPDLNRDVKEGDTILVDSGLLRLQVKEVHLDRIRTVVRIGGQITSRRHLNLPGVKVNLPCLTDKDREDILVGIDCGVDYYALSFVREPDDLDIMRNFVTAHGSDAPIIAKMEDQTAVANLDDIIRASDGVMVARGDLGIEVPFQSLPGIQRRAVRTCLRLGKPVIVATHMLESMIENPVPTRAEITDVANAVREQADCVMLSGETSVGKYPLECVETMNRIIGASEEEPGPALNTEVIFKAPKAIMLRAAVNLSYELPGSCLLVFTRNGYLARTLSTLRPRRSPIYAFTDSRRTLRRMLLLWGIEPVFMDFNEDPDQTIVRAMNRLKDMRWAQRGTPVVVITNVLAGEKVIDAIQLREVE